MRSIIPFYVPIEKDEDLTGWAHCLAGLNHMDFRQFVKEFFSYKAEHISEFSYICNLSVITGKYRESDFPSPRELIYDHTDIMAASPLTHPYRTAQRIQAMLYVPQTHDARIALSRRHLYYCPDCVREDMERIGRAVAHVPHQIPGASACYRHGLLLQDSPDSQIRIAAADDQMQAAAFLHDLYTLRPTGSINDTAELLKSVDEQLVKECGFRNLEAYTRKVGGLKNMGLAFTHILPVISRRFRAEELAEVARKDEKEERAACEQTLKRYAPSLGIIEWDYPFAQVLCNKCGNTATLFYGSILEMPICKYCMDSLSAEDRVRERVRVRTRGDFVFKSLQPHKRIVVTHKCGTDMSCKELSALMLAGKLACPECGKHIGERRKMNNGMYAEIIDYGGANDVTVQFENGITRSGIAYSNYILGKVAADEDHVGEMRQMNCEKTGEIVAWRTSHDIDVAFETGTVQHRTYSEFIRGKIRAPRPSRIGEEAVMHCGMRARIIRDGGCNDIDVVFSDGTVRTGVTYAHFRERTILPVKGSQKRTDRLGEERVMNCGEHATIIAYRNCKDIDVQFARGEVSEHRTYQEFQRGSIRATGHEM